MDFIVLIIIVFNIIILLIGFLSYKVELNVFFIVLLELIGLYFIYKVWVYNRIY